MENYKQKLLELGQDVLDKYPRKELVDSYLEDISYQLDEVSLQEAVSYLQMNLFNINKDYPDNKRAYLEVEHYGGESSDLTIKVLRGETDSEYYNRVNKELTSKEKAREAKRLKYLELKKEFEGE